MATKKRKSANSNAGRDIMIQTLDPTGFPEDPLDNMVKFAAQSGMRLLAESTDREHRLAVIDSDASVIAEGEFLAVSILTTVAHVYREFWKGEAYTTRVYQNPSLQSEDFGMIPLSGVTISAQLDYQLRVATPAGDALRLVSLDGLGNVTGEGKDFACSVHRLGVQICKDFLVGMGALVIDNNPDPKNYQPKFEHR